MKRYKEYIRENIKVDEDLLKCWFNAISNNDIESVRSYIDSGWDVNITEDAPIHQYGWNALMYACLHSYVKIVELLLNQPNIDVNSSTRVKNTPIMLVFNDDILLNNQIYTIKLLLLHPRIDLKLRNTENQSFFDLLINISNKEKIKHFIDDYNLQKQIMKNNIDNILLFNDNGLLNPKIKEENPDLFKAADWGLI